MDKWKYIALPITEDINFRPTEDDKKIRNGNAANSSRSVSRASATTVSSRPQSRNTKTIKRQSSIDLLPSPRKPDQQNDMPNTGTTSVKLIMKINDRYISFHWADWYI